MGELVLSSKTITLTTELISYIHCKIFIFGVSESSNNSRRRQHMSSRGSPTCSSEHNTGIASAYFTAH